MLIVGDLVLKDSRCVSRAGPGAETPGLPLQAACSPALGEGPGPETGRNGRVLGHLWVTFPGWWVAEPESGMGWLPVPRSFYPKTKTPGVGGRAGGPAVT